MIVIIIVYMRAATLKITGAVGEALLTIGVVLLAYAGYVLWGTGIETHRAQEELARQYAARLQAAQGRPAPADSVGLDEVYGVLRIPRFGASWEWLVVQGTRRSDLAKGPGHYPNTADPGELGNASFAGHRSGHGQPFARFDQLRRGDLIELETVNGAWTYRVDVPPKRISTTQAWVVDPAPGKAIGTLPTERRLTLTTCWPRYGSSHRLYASAILVDGKEL